MRWPFRRPRELPDTSHEIERSQVVGQLLFADEHDGLVTIDLVALSVRRPTRELVAFAPLVLQVRLPEDASAAATSARIRQWADEGEVVGLNVDSRADGLLTLRSHDSTLRVALADAGQLR